MEKKEIREGQIVTVINDNETLYKVIKINGGKAVLSKISHSNETLIAEIANLSLHI